MQITGYESVTSLINTNLHMQEPCIYKANTGLVNTEYTHLKQHIIH